MENELPTVTIIVPTKPGQAEIQSVNAARRLDYPRDKMEIIVARGRHPSIQRNHALRAATGEIIYFLDDDAQPVPDALRRAAQHFSAPEVQMVGGPNLCPDDAPLLEKIFAVVLGSWIAFGPSRARYDRVGTVRATGEKELILCNLLARRAVMLELGGFDESLYPNEENALMDALQQRGGKLIYDPDIVAHRRPRSTLRAFCKMLMTYGRGRAEQFRLHPTFGSVMNLVPPVFVLCLFLIPLWVWLGWFHASQTITRPRGLSFHIGIGWLPLVAYVFVLLSQTILNLRHGIVRACCALPLLFATHFFYGLGFWHGLFKRVNQAHPAPVEVLLERMPA